MNSENNRTWKDNDDDDEEDEDIREFDEELRESSPGQNVISYKREESTRKRQELLSDTTKMTDLQQNQRRDHHRHHHHRKITKEGGHIKEFIKPDPTVRRQVTHKTIRTPDVNQQDNDIVNHELAKTAQPLRVVTVVDEEQLHKRLVESSSKNKKDKQGSPNRDRLNAPETSVEKSVSDSASSSSSNSIGRHKSPLPTKILIPPEVAKSLSKQDREKSIQPVANDPANSQSNSNVSDKLSPVGPQDPPTKITKEQLEYGPFLKHDEVQVLYRSPEAADNALGVLRSFCGFWYRQIIVVIEILFLLWFLPRHMVDLS